MPALAQKAYNTIASIAGVPPEAVRDPIGASFKGRHDYALSENEDATMARVEAHCWELFTRFRTPHDKFTVEYDSFGNLYVTVKGASDAPGIGHGSHVDSSQGPRPSQFLDPHPS